MMEKHTQETDNLKRSWNKENSKISLRYVVNQDRIGKQYSFSTEEEDGMYSIFYEKKTEYTVIIYAIIPIIWTSMENLYF